MEEQVRVFLTSKLNQDEKKVSRIRVETDRRGKVSITILIHIRDAHVRFSGSRLAILKLVSHCFPQFIKGRFV